MTTTASSTSFNTILSGLLVTDRLPPFARYKGQESFFGQQPPLSEGLGRFEMIGQVQIRTASWDGRSTDKKKSVAEKKNVTIRNCNRSLFWFSWLSVGYLIILGFGALFSVVTTIIFYLNQHFGTHKNVTSEHFKYVSSFSAVTGSDTVVVTF